MLNQSQFEQLKTWTEADLTSTLPAAENADFEFKSSIIDDGKLRNLIQKAASGFWNSGGGCFVVGVNDKTGQPDGGILRTVGRTPRRDWIDRAIAAVSPGHPNGYFIQEIVSTGGGLNIAADRAVYVVGFVGSELAPHMAEGSYYIRSGAHTDPAPAFIVEGLFARRGKRQPQLRAQFRQHPILQHITELGIVNVGMAPAIDVEVEFAISPVGLSIDLKTGKATARKNRIDHDSALYVTYVLNLLQQSEQEKRLRSANNRITLRYKDQLLTGYTEEIDVQMSTAVTISSLDDTVLDRIALALRHISTGVGQLVEEKKAKPPG